MPSFGQVRLKEIQAMLSKCAPGHSRIPKKHPVWVAYRGKTFRALPRGEHGGKSEVGRGWVRKLARHLSILACAESQIPGL
jgi:hypothetical protein